MRAIGYGRFYGFTVSGDGRYLMGDFTVTHNCGKTLTVGKFLERRGFPNTYGIMHREELLKQARNQFLSVNPDLKIGLEKAELHADPEHDRVILASVQTVSHSNGKRLMSVPNNWPGITWIDEVQHAPNDAYLLPLDTFGLRGNNPRRDILLIGTTATPERLDRLGYDQIFDDVVFRYGLRDGIREGWLADIKAWKIRSKFDLSEVKVRHGDFVEKDLDRVVNTEAHNKLAADVWAQHCRRRRSLFFCVTKAHAQAVYEALCAAGARAAIVVAETPSDVRAAAIAGLRSGELEALVNVEVFTEGTDIPEIDCIHMLRPTRSRALFSQCVGRGTRKIPGKDYMELFDHTGIDHDVCSIGQVFGLPDSWELKGQLVEQEVEALEEAVEDLGLSVDGVKGVEDLQTKLRSKEHRIQLIKDSLTAADLPSSLVWIRPSREERYVIAWRNETREEVDRMKLEYQFSALEAMEKPNLFGISERIEIWRNELGKYEGRIYRRLEGQKTDHSLGAEPSLAKLAGRIEKWIIEKRPHKAGLMKKSARWARQPASPGQLQVLKRKGIPGSFLEAGALTKREASILMGLPGRRVKALFGETF